LHSSRVLRWSFKIAFPWHRGHFRSTRNHCAAAGAHFPLPVLGATVVVLVFWQLESDDALDPEAAGDSAVHAEKMIAVRRRSEEPIGDFMHRFHSTITSLKLASGFVDWDRQCHRSAYEWVGRVPTFPPMTAPC